MYICGRTADVPAPGDYSENRLKYGCAPRFRLLMMGTESQVWSVPVVRELLMPQPILRHVARRAVQVAIVAAGMLVILLVFSRQAYAATAPPGSSCSASVT